MVASHALAKRVLRDPALPARAHEQALREAAEVVGPEDDSLHDPDDELYRNESAWFPISIPERLVSGWLMIFHRPNMKLAGTAS